ncbi:MAG TPA: alpha/beta hydrolase [Anaerolineales bacterium]|nr:alpha/beta hydrolase [Anaerolineales bacterium]
MSILSQVITKQGVLENDRIVNYEQQGVGAPVILTHGLAASLHDWDELLPALAENGYAGYALDLLGHGESYKPIDHHDYTFKTVFDHFSGWIDTLRLIEPMILVGHSLGGGLSLQYALLHPERVRALVLVNPFYDIKQLSTAIQSAFLRQLLKTGVVDLTPYWLFRLFVDVTSFNYYIGHREAHTLPAHVRYQTALDFKRASSGIYNIVHTLPNILSDMTHIQQPTLLIWGKRDQTLSPLSFPRIRKLLPNVVAFHTMPICGHVPHQCHPQLFNAHVMKFLGELQANSSRV